MVDKRETFIVPTADEINLSSSVLRNDDDDGSGHGVRFGRRAMIVKKPKFSDSDSRAYANGLLSRKTVNQLLNPHEELTQDQIKNDILTEGQQYLSISFLVYIYSHLREMCRMGHTSVKMEDIDVHCPQSEQYEGAVEKRYLESNTKTAGSIIRAVIAELEGELKCDKEEDENLSPGHKEYHQSTMSLLQHWIEYSRDTYLDGETEEVISEMKRKVARRRWRRAIWAVRFNCRLSGGKHIKFEKEPTEPDARQPNDSIDMDFITKIEKDEPKYFHKGSVLHNLIESGVEVVWLSDLTPNDVVYGICVQRELKKVTVVFRGTCSYHNWMINFKYNINEYRNPVEENYPGRVDILRLHSGFSLYLMRERKDTGISKLQEICDKIDQIGREMAPSGDYKLSIVGHSLGGALATLCGFYIAARSTKAGSCFARLSRVNIWTFASPRVGALDFVHAWQHLERTGRIRHARFAATGDIVPLVPSSNYKPGDLHFYKHVGLQVQLHSVVKNGKWSLQRNLDNLDVTYPLRHDWASEIRRRFMHSHVSIITHISGITQVHELSEYQHRLRFAMASRNALGHHGNIKTLDEYYCSLANIPDGSILEETSLKINANAIKPISRWLLLIMVVSLTMLAWGATTYLEATSDVGPMERKMLHIDAVKEGTAKPSILVMARNKLAWKSKGRKNEL